MFKITTKTETLKQNQIAEIPQKRRYDLDWLRLIAIIVLLYYHVGMMYVSWGWHIQHKDHSIFFENMMLFLHQWRMPLLFFISGAGTYYALGFRSSQKYAGERTKRLFLPLLFGMFVIVPPQIYYERIFRGTFSGSYLDFYPQVLQFVPYPAGSFSWHHLWFVAYLFVYSLLALPFFLWLQKTSSERFKNVVLNLLQKKAGALWLVVPIIVSQILFRPIFPEETHALYNDWAYFTFYFLVFLYGYLLTSHHKFIEIISEQRRILLRAALAAIVMMYVIYWGNFFNDELEEVTWMEVVWVIDKIAVMWFSVLTTLAYAYRYLNYHHPLLKYANEGLYPFYILHQTVIIFIGFYVLQWNLGVYSGFLTVSTLSLLACIALYWFCIRPFSLIRFLFGMRAAITLKTKKLSHKTQKDNVWFGEE